MADSNIHATSQGPRQMSEEGIQRLKELEGFKPNFSDDCKGGMCGKSVAYGINCESYPTICGNIANHIESTGKDLTPEKGDEFFRKVLREFEAGVRRLSNTGNLNQNQFDTLTT